MFTVIEFLVFGISSCFLFIMTLQDIKERKISNKVVFSFLFFAVLVSLKTFFVFDFYDILIFLCLVFLGFILFYFSFWGAADTKVYFSLLFLFVFFFGGLSFFFPFSGNLLLLYSLGIVLLSIFTTSLRTKREVFLKLDHTLKWLTSIVVVALASYLYYSYYLFGLEEHIDLLWFMVFVVLMVILSIKIFSRWYEQYFTKDLWFIFGTLLLLFMVLSEQSLSLFYSVLLVFFIKLVVIYIHELFLTIKKNGTTYHSPFVVYLFLAFGVTIFCSGFFLLCLF